MTDTKPQGPTLLIVDDQPVNIQSLSNLLKTDYRVLIATSGEKALSIAGGKNQPDLILLDIQMPEMDGYEVCRRLKSDERTAKIPVIFITVRTSPDDEEKGLSLGAADYIPKPFQPKTVRARVRNLLLQKSVEKELMEYSKALERKNYELARLQDELVAINKDLDRRVEERTFEVERLLRQKNEFITHLGHDLNTPLTPLVALLPQIQKRLKSQETLGMIDVCIDNAVALKQIVLQTFYLLRLQQLKALPVKQPVMLAGIIDDIFRKESAILETRQIVYENTIPEDYKVSGDPAMIRSLFYNLISNSIKYSKEEGGFISINAKHDGDLNVITRVMDTGIGITNKDLKIVFDEYYKTDSSRHDRNSYGLGLSICRTIANLHKGDIRAESEGEGKGATVIVTLPGA